MSSLKYCGIWNINNDYNKNDLVYHNGNIYKTIQNIKKNTKNITDWTLYIDSNLIEIILREKNFMVMKDQWKYASEYQKGDLVFCNNVVFLCKKNIISYEPPMDDINNWEQLIGTVVKQNKPFLCELKTSISVQNTYNYIIKFNNVINIDTNYFDYIDSVKTIHIISTGLYKCTYNISTNINNFSSIITISDDTNDDQIKIISSEAFSNNNTINHTCILNIVKKSSKLSLYIITDNNNYIVNAKKTWLLLEKIK